MYTGVPACMCVCGSLFLCKYVRVCVCVYGHVSIVWVSVCVCISI